jgi:hypothetical protein
MVRLTTCGDAFEARLLAARLGSEGVVWSLRGGHDGPFAVGNVDVLVDADDFETAREVLLLQDFDGPIAEPDAEPERETTLRDVALIAAVLVGAIVFAIARMGAKV